jgi:hypothetical protein
LINGHISNALISADCKCSAFSVSYENDLVSVFLVRGTVAALNEVNFQFLAKIWGDQETDFAERHLDKDA